MPSRDIDLEVINYAEDEFWEHKAEQLFHKQSYIMASMTQEELCDLCDWLAVRPILMLRK